MIYGEIMLKNIFSGEDSQGLWDEINRLDAMSTGDEIRDVLYSFGCAMQKLEARLNRILENDKS